MPPIRVFPETMQRIRSDLLGWCAVALGLCTVIASLTVASTQVGGGLVFGFGAFIVFFGLLAALVRHSAPDHWGLFVVGLVLVLVPWLGDAYVQDRGAAWTAWVAGFLAMVLGGAGWLQSKRIGGVAISEYGATRTERDALSYWISRLALVTGAVAVLLGATVVESTPVGVTVLIGLGIGASVIAVWSLLAIDPVHDYLTLAVVGFALFLSPWVGGFTGDGAGWTAWVAGFVIAALGVTGYLRGDSIGFSTKAREDAEARYRDQYR